MKCNLAEATTRTGAMLTDSYAILRFEAKESKSGRLMRCYALNSLLKTDNDGNLALFQRELAVESMWCAHALSSSPPHGKDANVFGAS